MILAIIAALFCLAAGVVTFFPFFRKIKLLRPVGAYFVFEGIWLLASYALLQLNPNNSFIFPINYVVTILAMACCIFLMAKAKGSSRSKKKRNPDREQEM